MRGAVVLRPEPGNAATAARLTAAGLDVVRAPLFAVEAMPWTAPDPTRFDALLLTSANAPRHAGPRLHALASLPVLAVGDATAAAARAAGLAVRLTGERDAATLLATARAQGLGRLLRLTGEDHLPLPAVQAVNVYRSAALPMPPGAARSWEGRVALLHSARAARRFGELVTRDRADRAGIAVAALSPAVREAAGPGWLTAVTAERPTDAALVTCAAALIDPPGGDVDKQVR